MKRLNAGARGVRPEADTEFASLRYTRMEAKYWSKRCDRHDGEEGSRGPRTPRRSKSKSARHFRHVQFLDRSPISFRRRNAIHLPHPSAGVAHPSKRLAVRCPVAAKSLLRCRRLRRAQLPSARQWRPDSKCFLRFATARERAISEELRKPLTLSGGRFGGHGHVSGFLSTASAALRRNS